EVQDSATFLAIADEWNGLVTATNNLPFYQHEYIRNWIDNFAPTAKLRILLGRDPKHRLVAILPLIEERSTTSFHILPLRQLVSISNEYSCRFDLIARDSQAAASAFFAHLAADKSWQVIKIINVPDSGNAMHIYQSAYCAGYPVGKWEFQRSPYLQLPSCYQQLSQRLRSKFKANLRRRRKRLEEKGVVSLEPFTSGPALENHLQDCFAIEASGWKGQGGFAAKQHRQLHGFYNNLAQLSAANGTLLLLLLKLNGKPIAFQYCLNYAGVLYLIMTSYDESLKECSPGQLLMEESLKYCLTQGVKEFDFLGTDLSWKMEWSEQVRTHNWLYIFQKSHIGLALQKAKFNLIPAAKQLLECWRK
ncbi:MAG: GNAT family N-acetyltransferase, partial [Acidobacteriota bacterium]